jgi:ribosomal protein L12E/L44/L45/RPP1/RPP2
MEGLNGAGPAESRLRVGVDFLRDPRVRAAPYDERIHFLQQRAGLTRDEALEASRIADVADGASLVAPGANYRWWGTLAATAAAIGGGMALLSRDLSPRDFITDGPPQLELETNAAAKADVGDRLGHEPSTREPEPALLNGVRQLLAEYEARHERTTQLLREQLAVLVEGHTTTTAALERLSARLDEAIASATHAPTRAADAGPASKAAAATAVSSARAYSASAAAETTSLRNAHSELAGAGLPSSPFTPAGVGAWQTHAPAAHASDGLAHELDTPALPSPAPSVPPPTPASAVPSSVARLTYAEMVACVQQGKHAPGYVQVDDRPLGAAEQTPGTQPTRAARPKPWERAAMVDASAGTERRLGLGSASLTGLTSDGSEPSETPLPLTGHAVAPLPGDETEEWRSVRSPAVLAFHSDGVDHAMSRFEPFGLDMTPATRGRENESESEGPSTS